MHAAKLFLVDEDRPPPFARTGHRVCLVSSGAVGVGCQAMRLQQRPAALAQKQALAAIGQGALLRMWTDLFASLHMVRRRSA